MVILGGWLFLTSEVFLVDRALGSLRREPFVDQDLKALAAPLTSKATVRAIQGCLVH